jgi:hypothetical protein
LPFFSFLPSLIFLFINNLFGLVSTHHSLIFAIQLIRVPDKALLATFEKSFFSSCNRSKGPGVPPNKKKSFVGSLHIYPAAYSHPTTTTTPGATANPSSSKTPFNPVSEVDEFISSPARRARKRKAKEERNVNENGSHDGDLLEEAIVLTCWIVAESEHRLRHKILDFLREAAEEAAQHASG